MIAGLLWGKIYANTLQKRRLIALLFVCAATFAILTLRTTDFLLYVVLYGAMYAFQGPVHGLCDSFVMDSGKNFPVVRSFGALGYSAAVYLAGSYAEGHGLASIFYIYAITFVIAALVILRETEPPVRSLYSAVPWETAPISVISFGTEAAVWPGSAWRSC